MRTMVSKLLLGNELGLLFWPWFAENGMMSKAVAGTAGHCMRGAWKKHAGMCRHSELDFVPSAVVGMHFLGSTLRQYGRNDPRGHCLV